MNPLHIILLFTPLVFANWQGCIQQQDLESRNDGKVRRDSTTAVCLTIAKDAFDWADSTAYSRYSFAPLSDDYSRLVVDGCE
jgi:hypothetical protein